MSWLARSIANTLSLNEDDDDTVPNNPDSKQQPKADVPSSTSPRGVKEDLSEITKTLSRQFWGVASYLAPPPQSEPYKPLNENSDSKDDDDANSLDMSGRKSDLNESDGIRIAGIRSDLSEIGGKFKSGISKLSENINVTEITKMASSLLQMAADGVDEEAAKAAIGVTEDVVAFAKDIAMHPETWLDFPLPEDEVEEAGFDISDAQQEHALAVERLAPRLAALRMELCPGYMSESCFWKIYFVLLHPRLDKEVALLLSTPQVMEARALLAADLQNRTKAKTDNKSGDVSADKEEDSSFQREEFLSVPSKAPCEYTSQNSLIPKAVASTVATDFDTDKNPVSGTDIQIVKKPATPSAATGSETEKHPICSTEIEIVDKSVIEVEHTSQNNDQIVQSSPSNTWENRDEDDGDDWLKEEISEVSGAGGTTIPIDNDEDVSFSDLEDEDGDAPSNVKKVNYTSDKDSREWVQL